MTVQPEQVISAQVVLRPASGQVIDGRTAITAANIEAFTPSPEAVTRATRAFANAGFEVGAAIGNSFSITAPVRTFEGTFGTRLHVGDDKRIRATHDDGSTSSELSLRRLLPEVASLLVSVVFPRPPDFGPTNFGP